MKEYFKNKFNDKIIQKILNFNTKSKDEKNKEKLLLNKFKRDLNLLEESLKKTDCHYIHCIKINQIKKKNEFNSNCVLHQIRHMGIFDTISLKQNGFFVKLFFKEFYLKYEDVIDIESKPNLIEISKGNVDMKELSKKILEEIFPEYESKTDECLLGKSSVLMKTSCYDKINKFRRDCINKKEKYVTKLATLFRSKRIRRVKLYKNKIKIIKFK